VPALDDAVIRHDDFGVRGSRGSQRMKAHEYPLFDSIEIKIRSRDRHFPRCAPAARERECLARSVRGYRPIAASTTLATARLVTSPWLPIC
jgi:hypothetical protein